MEAMDGSEALVPVAKTPSPKARKFIVEDHFTMSNAEYVDLCKTILGKNPMAIRMYRSLSVYTKLHFRICNAISVLYFELEPKTQRVVLIKSKFRMLLVKFHAFLHWAYTLIMMTYFFSTVAINPMSARLLAFAFIASWGVCALMQTEFWKHRSEAVFLFRSIQEFEERYLPAVGTNKTAKKDKICVFLMGLGIVSCFGLPGLMSVMLLVDPCRPPHLGYMLFKKSLDVCSVPNWTARILTLGFDVYLWIVALPIGLFYVFQGLLVGVRCQDFYLRLLRGGLKRPIVNLSRNRKDQICIRIYRELQIMNRLFNTVFKGVFFPGVISVGMFVAIMGMFACLKLRKVIPFPAIMFFPIIASDGFSVIFIVKIAAGAFIQSRRLLGSMSKTTEYPRKTAYRKTVLSLDEIKIRFGGNFVDQMTPLVFMDFIFSQTVSLMLLTDK